MYCGQAEDRDDGDYEVHGISSEGRVSRSD